MSDTFVEGIAIKVDNVSKVFKLPHEKHTTLKSSLIHFWDKKKGYEKQDALRNINFEIKNGEFFGIVGRNGSGKSTLLKILAGIYRPTKGNVIVNGKLTPFIELGVGFSPELTGRENVFLNGSLLGFNRNEMQKMYKEIVEFAELEKFMDQKLKNYSSGMQVRLAFSIAIRAESDILLIDEVLAVGDSAFQQKCFRYFDKLKNERKTVVFVTHDMGSFEKYCDRGVLIQDGVMTSIGEPYLLSAEYKMLNISETPEIEEVKEAKSPEFDDSIKEVFLNGKKQVALREKDNLVLEINVIPKKTQKTVAGVSIINESGVYVAFHNTETSIGKINLTKGQKYTFKYTLPMDQFIAGAYIIDVALYDSDNNYIDIKGSVGKFALVGEKKTKSGILNLKGSWEIED